MNPPSAKRRSTPLSSDLTRRHFLAVAGALGALPSFAAVPGIVSKGSDRIRVGVVGLGGRGTGAARDCVAADPAVQIVALADLFPDRVEAGFKALRDGNPTASNGRPPLPSEQFAVTPDLCFSGFDAYKKVLESKVDIVILATPPHFRPVHLEASIAAGVNVFAEKPVAVDPAGVRRVIAVAAEAKRKNLAIVAGTQRRHATNYLEAMKRIQDGAIGELVGGQAYWLQDGLWHRGRQPEWSEMEYQVRNWLYFTWLSGDHIVEQHIHNLDVMNWAFGGPPVKAFGMGGRQSRTDAKYGNVFDHFSIEYEYANGARVQSFCRQAPGASGRVGERLVGTKGVSNPARDIQGQTNWKYDGPEVNSMVQEHRDLIASIRAGTPLNDAVRIAESTLTAILGRTSAYTGREISFKWLLNTSTQDLSPSAYAFGAAPKEDVAIPGVTQLV